VTDDPFNDPDYADLCARLAKDCRCGCEKCEDRPCAGLLACGVCDEADCDCDYDDFPDDDEDTEA